MTPPAISIHWYNEIDKDQLLWNMILGKETAACVSWLKIWLTGNDGFPCLIMIRCSLFIVICNKGIHLRTLKALMVTLIHYLISFFDCVYRLPEMYSESQPPQKYQTATNGRRNPYFFHINTFSKIGWTMNEYNTGTFIICALVVSHIKSMFKIFWRIH